MEQAYLEEESSKGFDFKRYIAKVAKNWYWFVLATALFVGGAFAYLYYTPTTYNVSAFVLVKKPSDATNMLGGSAFGSGGKETWLDVNNEIFKFKSGSLIRQIVDSLDLTTQVKTEIKGKKTILSNDSLPFKLSVVRALPEMNSPVYKLKLSNTTYTVELDDKNYTGQYNRPLALYGDTILLQARNGTVIPAKKRIRSSIFWYGFHCFQIYLPNRNYTSAKSR